MAKLCLIHLTINLVLLTARIHCWLTLSQLLTRNPRFWSAELLSSHSFPSKYLCLAILHPRCSKQHFPLLIFMTLMIAQYSNMFRSYCKVSHPSRESTTPPNLVSANFLMGHSTPASKSLMKMLNRTGPRIELWGTSLVTV